MTKYARITSSTGAIIEEKDEAEFRGGKPPAANVAKDWEWLPVTIEKPSFDSETEVLEGPKDVVTAEKITRKWTVAKLSDKKLDEAKEIKLRVTDRNMAEITEELMVAIATGKTLNRAAFSDATWEKINERRTIRGESEV
tara:strand:+ start:191 stop:610 length:420 start_codon:yes stop_codon:yes gene_type:complete